MKKTYYELKFMNRVCMLVYNFIYMVGLLLIGFCDITIMADLLSKWANAIKRDYK